MSATIEQPKPSLGGIVKNGAIAGLGAAVVNAVLYFVGSAMGGFPQDVLSPLGVPITLGPVVGVTIGATIAAIVVYFLLTRFLRKQLADRVFLILGILVLIGYLFPPFQLPGVQMLQIVFLQIMHLVAGGALLYNLPKSA